jgi:Mce-associated membrane protein
VTPAGDTQEGGSTGSGRSRWPVLPVALLVLVLLAASAVAIWSGLRLQDSDEALSARSEVVQVAERFAVTVNNYDSGSVDDYKSSVTALLSTKFRAEFDSAMEDIVTQVQQAEMASQGEVLASGVATMDEDSARVLVVADAAVETIADERQRHFRWEVSLVKVDGEWLVDDFAPVA